MAEKLRGDIEQAAGNINEVLGNYPESKLVNEKLQWFEDQKLGVIFHWGLYAKAGIVESWQLSEVDDWARVKGRAWREDIKDLQKDYWNLIEEFNPSNFNPQKWAKTCKDAGFKYMIFTTKHHDGFHLWDTAQSDYKVNGSRSPYKDDLFRQVVEAFRAEGLGIGAYYSKADWYSDMYWTDKEGVTQRRADYDPEEKPELWNKYVEYVHNELEELTSNYGKIDILWLDGGWCGKGKEDLRMDELAEKVRKHNPDLLIVDRMMGGRHENYVTPERTIPAFDQIPKKSWESNVPLGKNWGYVVNDIFKPSKEIIENVLEVVGKGGNVILGVGPTAEGEFTPASLSILKDLGTWLETVKEGIYGTRAVQSALVEGNRWVMTQKDGQYYAFYPLESGEQRLIFPVINIQGKAIQTITALDNGQEIDFLEKDGQYIIHMPHREFAWQIAVFKITV